MSFNQLTDAEAERLALLLEELGEAQQVIGKILRHGYASHHPDNNISNRTLLTEELGDVLAAIDLMVKACDLKQSQLSSCMNGKLLRVHKYLHHQESKP